MTAKIVEIRGKDGTGKDWSGKYPFLSATPQRITVQLPGGKTAAFPRGWAVDLPESFGVTLSYEELLAVIRDRFDTLDRLLTGVIEGRVRSLIVSGSPGCGKTHSIESRLEEAKRAGKIARFTVVRGTISPIGLYMLLWQNRREGEVVVLDDADHVLFSEEGASLCKAATDSGKKRNLCYYKDANALVDNGVPKSFVYEGTLCVATNIDMEREVRMQSKAAAHLSAILNRALYVDLALHETDAKMARVEDVCRNSPMLHEDGLDDVQIDELVRWLSDNRNKVRSLSLRTAKHLASIMLSDPERWKKTAKDTLLKAAGK